MAKKNLYELIGKTEKGKTPLGYSLGQSYNGVLESLYSPKIVYNDIEVAGQSQGIATRQYSTLGTIGLGGYDDGSGFIVYGDETISYQALCTLKEYMSFIVDYTGEDGMTKCAFVSVPNRPMPNSHASKGYSLLNQTQITFPPYELNEDTILSIQQGIGQDRNTCIIGAGISFHDFALKFMKRYFGDIQWKPEWIEILACKGHLYVEVVIPQNTSKAKVLHTKVTIKHQTNDSHAPFEVWLPIPLLLLNDYKQLGTVIVNIEGKGEQKIGEGDARFPLASRQYNHKNASISGFTPSFLKAYIKDDNITKYIGTTLKYQDQKLQARVRLYIGQAGKQELKKLIGAEIPQSCSKELFKGQAEPNSYINTVTAGSGIRSNATGEISYKPGQVNWEELGKKAPQMLAYREAWESLCSKGNVNVRMVLAIHVYETGWGRSDAWKLHKNPGGLLYSRLDGNYSPSKVEYEVWRKRDKFGGIQAKIINKGTDHGRLYEFRTHADGIAAKIYLLLNSENYGINLGRYNTVGDFFTGLQKGVPHQRNNYKPDSYCPTVTYTKGVTNCYNSIPQ